MGKKARANILLVLTALIWGCAFVAQSSAMDFVGPFTYNTSRNVLAFFTLLIVVKIFNRGKEKSKAANRISVIGGICCGLVLGVASAFQQVGVSMTTAGKGGFITALYIIIVPIFGIFIGKKIPKIIWLCVALAIFGFYLLCVNEGFSISTGDLFVLACAFCFAVHILVIDHFTDKKADGIKMSCIQFLVAAIVSAVLMFIFEEPQISAIWDAKIPILYAGIMSSSVGYTLQIVAQKDTDPTTATLLMSLESVFAALAGWLFLHELLSLKELAGCIVVFAAVIIAQIPFDKLTHKSDA